ncbi:hypothetical protein [Streptomyces sp. NPDC003032]
MTRTVRERIGTVVTLAGVAAAGVSVRHTAEHVWDDTYQVPQARLGAGHVQYHMAREALITTAALGALVTGVLAGPDRDPALWRAMAVVCAGHCLAMWSAGVVTGRQVPNRRAVRTHMVSTAGLITGVALLRPRER